MTEFDIIKNYFAAHSKHRTDVIHGIGDDAAVVKVPAGRELVITTDTLVSGIHFFPSTEPYDIGYKSLAVNLSDLAAMGATPAFATLALTLPAMNENWLRAFCDGFFDLANHHHVALIGGDLTQGPLAITVQAMGFVPAHLALLRSHAKPDDLIYVTGTLGDAGLALAFLQNKIQLETHYQQAVTARLNHPTPRIKTGEGLRNIAHAAIDISDGLAADLSHILEQSQVGAIIHVDQLPLSAALTHSLSSTDAIALALTAGDDYELCFTLPAEKQTTFKNTAGAECRYTCIGTITAARGLELRHQNGSHYHGSIQGYQHF